MGQEADHATRHAFTHVNAASLLSQLMNRIGVDRQRSLFAPRFRPMVTLKSPLVATGDSDILSTPRQDPVLAGFFGFTYRQVPDSLLKDWQVVRHIHADQSYLSSSHFHFFPDRMPEDHKIGRVSLGTLCSNAINA